MRTQGIWTGVIALIVVVIIFVGAVIAMFRYTNSAFILGVLPVAAAIVVAAIQYRQAKDNETNARLFSEKQAAYTELIGLMMGHIHQGTTELSPEDQLALVDQLRRVRTQLVIWGSSATLLTLDRLASVGSNPSGVPTGAITWMAELFAAIRKDLGHKDPPGSALEMALGILQEPDRSTMRTALATSNR